MANVIDVAEVGRHGLGLRAVLEILGDWTWRLPRWLDRLLPHVNIEGSAARRIAAERGRKAEAEKELEPTGV